ncbi:hypothetical protein ARMSODRAFT_1061650 [Armillaria solidipes]|uniref:Endonuclease/exonuclease/phosphatase domain-containing protein n=1 Tax=Armillaria solidipes TaxID=1076256 RepID=A0A2H3BEJ2_9AGAR|nr:hypothetical protein ARMSODRAFT_1061650 [Armillaria solidipes]
MAGFDAGAGSVLAFFGVPISLISTAACSPFPGNGWPRCRWVTECLRSVVLHAIESATYLLVFGCLGYVILSPAQVIVIFDVHVSCVYQSYTYAVQCPRILLLAPTLFALMEGSSQTDGFLDTLRNLPALPPAQIAEVAEDTPSQDTWCGPDSQADDDDDIGDMVIDVGPHSSSPPKSSPTWPPPRPKSKVTAGKEKATLKRKLSAFAPENGDAAASLVGPASNTRSMRGQTEASFVAAGGEPSSSAVPRKRAQFAATSPVHEPHPSPDEWKSAVFNLRSHLEKELLSLRDQLQTAIETSVAPQPPVDLHDLLVDIANLQKRVSDWSTIVTTRFTEHHTAIAGLTTTVSSLPSLSNTLTRAVGRLTNLEAAGNQNSHSADAYRVLEGRVAELEKALLSTSASTAVITAPTLSSTPTARSAPSPMPSSPPVNLRRQIVITGVQVGENPWDPVALMMGCIPTLSMAIVLTVRKLPSSASSVVVAFFTEQNAKDFMSAARSLPERFLPARFLWADSPDSPIRPVHPSAPLPPTFGGPFVDDRHGINNSLSDCSVPHVDQRSPMPKTFPSTDPPDCARPQWLSLCSWNINGHLPLKIRGEDVKRVPDNYFAIFRSRPYTRGKPWGGLCAIIRDELRYLVIDELLRPDLLVLQLPCCYLVAGYVAPTSSKVCTRAVVPPFQYFTEALTFLASNSDLPLVGLTDVNGRIGTTSPANAPPCLSRLQSVDTKSNARGNEFIDACYDANMVVLNGLQITEGHEQGGAGIGLWYTTSKKLLTALNPQPTYHMMSSLPYIA